MAKVMNAGRQVFADAKTWTSPSWIQDLKIKTGIRSAANAQSFGAEMNSIFRSLAALLFVLPVATGACMAREMTFAFVGNGGNCNGCEWISAEGEIVDGSPEKFEQFIASNQLKEFWLTVYINSPGGDALAAMRLGDLVRKYHLDVEVGSTKPFDKMFGTETTYDTGKGSCEGACILAFVGGVERHANPGELGFTTFKPPIKWAASAFRPDYQGTPKPLDLFAALVADYFTHQGVDSGLMSLLTGPANRSTTGIG